jgi:hypothetical protein
MITKEHEDFNCEWGRCEEIIYSGIIAETGENPNADKVWVEEMEAKWLDPESPDCIMDKHESWEDINKFLWEHYVSEEKRAKWFEVWGHHGWEAQE